MKKTKSLLVTMLSATVISIGTPILTSTADAATIENSSSSNTHELDLTTQEKINPYVEVKDNRYVLNEKVKSIISSQDYALAKQLINHSNNIVSQNYLTINKKTKTADETIIISDNSNNTTLPNLKTNLYAVSKAKRRYHNGVNKVSVHWNYVRIYLSKSMTKAAAAGSITGLSTLIGGAISSGSAAPAIAAAVGAFIGSVVDSSIKGGIWVDYNYYVKGPTKWGWQ
ncbi:hypothetical protein [Lactobacillus sp. PSON]|uniref:hypothetical protein n=1 Tax=Lactobacillus sp. PSON TaxID=3455454 RepID=UPI0040427CB1